MAESFSQRLKKYRKAKNLTQQELAEQIGVSDKTVSRWESEGGYPDVAVLAPLARALGVTVDDLLDEKAPVRTLTRADWQSFLSFALALGGGVVYFLLDLFMPGALCYLFYLACLAWGTYLQKYYTCQSRWFLLGEGVVNFFVNFSFALTSLSTGWALGQYGLLAFSGDRFGQAVQLAQGGVGQLVLVYVLALAVALLLTALTQYLVVKKGLGGVLPNRLGLGHGEAAHRSFRLTLGTPRPRLLPVALAPVIAGLYWLPGLQQELILRGVLDHEWRWQNDLFGWLIIVLAVLVSLPLLKKGYRRWLLPAWATVGVCGGMTGLVQYKLMWSDLSDQFLPWAQKPLSSGHYFAVGEGSWGTAVCAAALCILWLILSCVRLEDAGEKPEESEPA